MANLSWINAKVSAGLGRAAAVLGAPTTQVRPLNPLAPLDPSAVVSVIPAAFDTQVTFGFAVPEKPGQNLFYLLADAAALSVGDYLITPPESYFVASLEDLKPAMVVRTNAVLSLVRPVQPLAAGLGNPGGDSQASEVTLLVGWPASVMSNQRAERGDVNLPGDARMGMWQIQLPQTLDVAIRGSDILVDQDGLRHLVMSAELGPLGWRIEAVQEAA